MMHYSQQGYEGMGMGEQQPTSPQSPEEAGVQDGVRGHASINTILDQIMTITDQSLDEVHILDLLLLRERFIIFLSEKKSPPPPQPFWSQVNFSEVIR